MKLLILTQKVDMNDAVLGFFHSWLREFAARFDSIIVVCLEEGKHELPANVRVLSLGKERSGAHKLDYIRCFYRHVWAERGNYDSVFVHMNQEYSILGGPLWKLLGKKSVLWRNHPDGSALTRLAVLLSDKVMCTSPHSFTARFAKTMIMPVGIDTDFFRPAPPGSASPEWRRHTRAPAMPILLRRKRT